MTNKKKTVLAAGSLVVALSLFQFFYPGTPDDVAPRTGFEVVAHRGVHQNFQRDTVDPLTGCEARHMAAPTHHYIENTVEAIDAAFSFGATIVELDIKRSSDDQLVVFHDDGLECRTNGHGNVSDHPLTYLQTLDVGYGYTADDGQTYPLRGEGVGQLPTLIQILQRFPDKKFLIDHKDGSMQSAKLLVAVLQSLPAGQTRQLYYWGPDETYQYVHQAVPAVTPLFSNRSQIKDWLLPYILTLGVGDIPPSSKGYVMPMPPQYIKVIAGWPYRFLNKVARADARFYLYIDAEEDARAYLNIPVDGIVTDHIEIIGKYYRRGE